VGLDGKLRVSKIQMSVYSYLLIDVTFA
jgi:hypothetical protein